MESSFKNLFSLAEICTHLSRNGLGIWQASHSKQCHYPEDGARRFVSVEDNSFWFVHRRKCIIEMIKRFPPQDWILDVGGGNGFVTLGMLNSGINAVLLEPGSNAALNAHQRGIPHIINTTLDQAKFDQHSVPAIGIFDVLEHIEDDCSFIKELKRVLQPEGKLYLTVPAYKCLWSLEDQYAEHFRRYQMGSLCKKLDKCGFVVDYSTYLFSYLALPLFFIKVIPTKLGLAKIYTHEQTQKEHVIQSGIIKKVLDGINARERNRINKGNTIRFGTSIMISAHAK